MSTWKIVGEFADGELTDLSFIECLALSDCIERAAEKAEMPGILAGIS